MTKIQLERNVSYFGLDKGSLAKKEMDIVVFHRTSGRKHCIEIKYPTNGQVPEQMFSMCKDISFLEQLVDAGFSDSYSLVVANDPLFYDDNAGDGIYQMFRVDKCLRGTVRKPTGQKDITYTLRHSYNIEWVPVSRTEKYFLIRVDV